MTSTDKIEVLSSEIIRPMMSDRFEVRRPSRHESCGEILPPIRPRTQSWIGPELSSGSSTSANSAVDQLPPPKLVRRRRIRHPRPFLLRIKIAGLNNVYRSTLFKAKVAWSLIVAVAMCGLAWMLFGLVYARYIREMSSVKVDEAVRIDIESMALPAVKICVKPTVSGETIRENFVFPHSRPTGNRTPSAADPMISLERGADYGEYLTVAWSLSSGFWWSDLDLRDSMLVGARSAWAQKVFANNFDVGIGFVKFLHNHSSPECDSLVSNCRIGQSGFDCCSDEKALAERRQYAADPSLAFDQYGRCFALSDRDTMWTKPGFENGQHFEIDYPKSMSENALLTLEDAPDLAPIPLPAGYETLISIRVKHSHIPDGVNFKRFNHTCLDECIAARIPDVCGCRSVAAPVSDTKPNDTVGVCTPIMEFLCAMESRSDVTADPYFSEMERGFMTRRGNRRGLCGHCTPVSDKGFVDTIWDVRVTFVELMSRTRSRDTKARVTVMYPDYAVERVWYGAVGRQPIEPWRVRALMAFFGGMSVISIVQTIYYVLVAVITRRCSPRPVARKMHFMVNGPTDVTSAVTAAGRSMYHIARPFVQTTAGASSAGPGGNQRLDIIPEGNESEHEPSSSHGGDGGNGSRDDAGSPESPHRPPHSSVVAWTTFQTDPSHSRPSSARRRSSVMATYLNKLIALPYTDDGPAKEKTKVDAVVPFNEHKPNKSSDEAPSTVDGGPVGPKRKNSIQTYMEKISQSMQNRRGSGASAGAPAAVVTSEPVRTFSDTEEVNEGPVKTFLKSRRLSMPSFSISPSHQSSPDRLPEVNAHSNKVVTQSPKPAVVPLFRRHSSFLQVPPGQSSTQSPTVEPTDAPDQSNISQLWGALITEGPHIIRPGAEQPPSASGTATKPKSRGLLQRARPSALAQIKETSVEYHERASSPESKPGGWFDGDDPTVGDRARGRRRSSVVFGMFEQGGGGQKSREEVNASRRRSVVMPTSEMAEDDL